MTRQPRTDDIAPLVPIMPGGPEPSRSTATPRRPAERPPDTGYATTYTRDTEEIEPLVPDLSRAG